MKCLYIAAQWPLPSLSAAGRRSWDILDALSQQLGAEVHIACHAEVGTRWRHWAASRGVAYQRIELNRSSFDVWIKSLNPDWVFFDRFLTEEQYGWRVARHLPEALKVLDMQDWHALRYARASALQQDLALNSRGAAVNEGSLSKLAVGVTSAPVFQRELSSMLRSDLVLVISRVECREIQRTLQQLQVGTQFYPNPEQVQAKDSANEVASALSVRLAYFPFVHRAVSPISQPGFEQRQHCIFVGNFLHEPNVDAVCWLRECIWPQVKQVLPEAECHLYGTFISARIQRLHHTQQGFLVKGVLQEDVQTALSAYRINLAPLRFGAGLKGKVFDAALWGTPTVMTCVAAEGLFTDDTLGIAAADDDLGDSFAQVMIRFYQCQQDWHRIREQQQVQIFENFKQTVWTPKLVEALRQVEQTPAPGHFLQTLMNHQGHRANAYFSRWIELKETGAC